MKKIDWKRPLPYMVAVVVFLLFSLAYCSPLLEGKVLQAGDVTHWEGFSHEAREYKAQTGETTWWTNSLFGGMPTFQITGSTPANVLRGRLQYITQFGMTGDWEPVGLLMGYLLGFYLMLLCFGVNPWLSVVGSFALTLSTYFMLIIPAGHITKASGLAALAPMIGGMYAIFRRRYWLGAPLFLLYGIIGLNLHPQMTYYMAMLMGVMALGEVYQHVREKQWNELTISVLVLMVCAGMVYGSKLSWMKMNTEYLAETMRGGHSELNQEDKSEKAGLDLDYVTAWSYGVDETMTLLIPNFMGGASGYDVGTNSSLYKGLVKARVPKNSAKQFCGQAPTYRGEKMFTSGPVYVGAVICFLFVLALLIVPGTYKWVLLIATLFSLMLAWGRNFMPLTEFFYNYFPMYNKFRAVESILVVAEITIPLLALLGVQRLVADKGNDSSDRKQMPLSTAVLIAGVVTGGLCLFVALFGGSVCDFTSSYDTWKSQMGNDIYQLILSQRASMLKADAWRSFAFIVLAVVVVWMYTEDKMRTWHLYVALGILILFDLVPVNRRFFGSQDFVSPKAQEAYFNMQPWEEEILRDKDLSYRVLNVNTNTFNDSRTSYRLKSVGGYSAAKLRRYQDLIDAHISRNNFSVLNMLNTRYFITRDGVKYNPAAYGNAWFVDSLVCVSTADAESDALNTLDLKRVAVTDTTYAPNRRLCESGVCEKLFRNEDNSTGKITLTDYAPNRLTFTASTDRERLAVFSEIYYPSGWHLYVDGEEQPIERVNYTLRATIIPAGSHTVMMEFVPDALKTDRWCVAIIIVALLASVSLLLSPIVLSLLRRGKE